MVKRPFHLAHQLPKKIKYPLQMEYQLGSYFKPSHLSSKKFRRKLTYKLKTSVIYSIIKFEALFIYHEWTLLSHVIVEHFLSKEGIDNAQNT